jgi:hypothetical protein
MIVERVNSGLARAKAKGIKLGRGNKKDGGRRADEERWKSASCASTRAARGTVQRVLMEQPRPFDIGVAGAAFEPLTPDAFGDPHFCPKQVCAGAMPEGWQ